MSLELDDEHCVLSLVCHPYLVFSSLKTYDLGN